MHTVQELCFHQEGHDNGHAVPERLLYTVQELTRKEELTGDVSCSG